MNRKNGLWRISEDASHRKYNPNINIKFTFLGKFIYLKFV